MSVQLNQTALWQNLRELNQLQKEQIQILEKLIEVLPSSEDEVIDEWLDRLESHTKHRFTDEETRMIRSGYPFYLSTAENILWHWIEYEKPELIGKRIAMYCRFGIF